MDRVVVLLMTSNFTLSTLDRQAIWSYFQKHYISWERDEYDLYGTQRLCERLWQYAATTFGVVGQWQHQIGFSQITHSSSSGVGGDGVDAVGRAIYALIIHEAMVCAVEGLDVHAGAYADTITVCGPLGQARVTARRLHASLHRMGVHVRLDKANICCPPSLGWSAKDVRAQIQAHDNRPVSSIPS